MGVEVVALPECHAHHQEYHQAHPQQDGHVHRVVVCCWLMPTIYTNTLRLQSPEVGVLVRKLSQLTLLS
jgi:hypothetical protein